MTLKATVDQAEYDAFPAELQAEYEEKDGKFYLTPPEGFKTVAEFNKVHTALANERNLHKDTKTKLNTFTALGKPEDVQAQLDRIPELELAAEGKLDTNKIDELVEKRIKARILPVERERDTLKTQVTTLASEVETFKTRETRSAIESDLLKAADKLEVSKSARADVAVIGLNLFERDESGKIVGRDGVPGITAGITPEEWLKDQQSIRTHWWPGSSGGGGRPGEGGGGVNPWKHETWNMTEQGKILTQDRARAERLAKQAGTTIGGTKPPPKK